MTFPEEPTFFWGINIFAFFFFLSIFRNLFSQRDFEWKINKNLSSGIIFWVSTLSVLVISVENALAHVIVISIIYYIFTSLLALIPLTYILMMVLWPSSFSWPIFIDVRFPHTTSLGISSLSLSVSWLTSTLFIDSEKHTIIITAHWFTLTKTNLPK